MQLRLMLGLALALLATRPAIASPIGQALPDCNAADKRCQILKTKIIHLRERDPGAEAASAAKRGDFRLGAHNYIGPGARGWDTPGVECGVWTRDLISKWHVNQDVILPGDSEHSAAAMAFLAAYNKAMVSDPAFPYPISARWKGVSLRLSTRVRFTRSHNPPDPATSPRWRL